MKIVKNSKLLLKIFSGLIAVILWFAVTYTEDPSINQHLGSLSINFTGEAQLAEQGLIIVDKDRLPIPSAVIRGKRSKVISALDRVTTTIDVSKITKAGTHEVPIEYIYPSDMVMLTRTKFSTVTVTAERLLSRDIPVKIKTEPNKREKETIISFDSTIDTITVQGAQSTVDKIAYALVEINESDISTNGTMSYPYTLCDKNGNVLDEENIFSKSSNSVPVDHKIYTKVEIPVEIVLSENLQSSYTLKIDEQSISTVIAGISDNEKPDEIYAILDKEHIDNDGEATLELDIPEGVYVSEESRSVTIKYDIQKKSVYQVEVNVSAANLPEHKDVTISPQKINVSVKCAKEDATPKKITATIDANALADNVEKTVNVKVSADKDIQVLGNYTVTAVLH